MPFIPPFGTPPLTSTQKQLFKTWNGTFLETIDFTVTSNGTTITGSLEQSGTGDLTMVFSDGSSTFDCTPAATVSLTAGSDTAPQKNFVYILQSDKTQMTVSTSDWPSEEHIKIAEVVLISASTTQTEGALVNRNWNDHTEGTDNQGHFSHTYERLRWEHSAYKSGSAVTWTITTNAGAIDNIDLAITAGKTYQLHLHDVGAFDTTDPDNVHFVNHPTTAYLQTADIEDVLVDSNNVSMSGKYYNLVVWCSVSSGSEPEHVFINLPSGSYNKQGDATADVSGFDNYDIPSDFRGYAYLINRITLRHQAAASGTFTNIQENDLRGQVPNIVAGGGTAAITTEFADNQFKLFDDGDSTKEIAFQASGITTSTTRTLTSPDASGTLALTSQSDGTITESDVTDLIHPQTISCSFHDSSPSDSTTYYFGGILTLGLTDNASAINRQYIGQDCTLKRVDVFIVIAGATGSGESVSVYFRKNGTTDTTLSTTMTWSAVTQVVNKTGLSVSLSAGDYFEIKVDTPAWATNPTNVYGSAQVHVE